MKRTAFGIVGGNEVPATSQTLAVISRATLAVLMVGLSVVPADAKGPVVKLVVSGPHLHQPIDLTDGNAIDVTVYGATFIEREQGPRSRSAGGPLGPYQVEFYVDVRRQGVQMMYAVDFVWDASERRGFVYFPGPADSRYERNVRTVAQPTAGQWFHATDVWGRAIQRAILAHIDLSAYRGSRRVE